MIALTLAEVAEVTGGALTGSPDATVTGAVTLDSRTVATGDLFVAVAGERVDGHDFLPAAIRAAMLAGVADVPDGRRAEVHEVAGRRDALAAAVALAAPGDTLLVAGKGHETGQEVAGTVHPFDDRAVLREVLAALGSNA